MGLWSKVIRMRGFPSPGLSQSCWACYGIFDDMPNGTKPRHNHHVIPRAYGGSKGPTVDLCNEDHAILHDLATQEITKKDGVALKEFLHKDAPDFPRNRRENLVQLAQYVVDAERLTNGDPNKRVTVTVILKGEEGRKLDEVGKVLGSKSRAKTLSLLIELQHTKLFPLRKL